MRRSDLALVLIRLKIDGDPHLVLIRHPKWNDWTLVGGHVEQDERYDWARAAARECNEELAPLRFGEDFTLLPLLDQPIRWGPVASRSAGHEPTLYTAQFFALRFLKDPIGCLARLPSDDFRIVRESDIIKPSEDGPMALTERALLTVNHRPLAWDAMLPAPAMPRA